MEHDGRNPLKLIAVGLLVVYGIAFVIANDEELSIDFIFFETRIALLVALILIAALAFVVGFVARGLYEGRRDD